VVIASDIDFFFTEAAKQHLGKVEWSSGTRTMLTCPYALQESNTAIPAPVAARHHLGAATKALCLLGKVPKWSRLVVTA
jgi:hypothetical protein